MPSFLTNLTQVEKLNFLITNRVPRAFLTRMMGWYSRIENPLLTRFSIAIWKLFSPELDFSESRQKQFRSLHECFTRELNDNARPVDMRAEIVSSPCDAIIGACGNIDSGTIYQAKGFPYDISDLIPDQDLSEKYNDGTYVTLRLKSSMYHRFHAPVDCQVNTVTYISGDTWNVNPIALKRIEKLYCKNERAVIELRLMQEQRSIVLVPVAAILVASMKIHCLENELNLQYRGPNVLHCDARYSRGDELGYFQHGSTIILFASSDYILCPQITQHHPVKMGEALLQRKNRDD
jgi:phosphatidylserine decarboxylase